MRIKFRYNPGFVTAAVSGTIGMVLALILLLSGWQRPGTGQSEEKLLAEAEPPALGSGSELPPTPDRLGASNLALDRDTDLDESEDDPFKESTRPSRPVRRVRPLAKPSFRTGVDDEHFLADDDSQSQASTETEDQDAAGFPPARVTIHLHNDESGLDRDEPKTEEADEETYVNKTQPGRLNFGVGTNSNAGLISDLVLDENNFDIGAGSAREPFADDSSEEEPADEEPESTLPAKPSSVLLHPGRQTVEDEDATEEEVAADEQPFAEPQPPPKVGWRYTPSRTPVTTPEPSGQSVEQSRAVETAVYAAPAEDAKPAPRKVEPERPSVITSAGLTLAVSAPEEVTDGQQFPLEFSVTNSGRSTVQGAILSATLPKALTHPLGPEVEHTVPTLRPGQTHRVRLMVETTAAGDATARADVVWQGKVEAKSTARIHVNGSRDRPSRSARP